jgi:D-serine dehydratase
MNFLDFSQSDNSYIKLLVEEYAERKLIAEIKLMSEEKQQEIEKRIKSISENEINRIVVGTIGLLGLLVGILNLGYGVQVSIFLGFSTSDLFKDAVVS